MFRAETVGGEMELSREWEVVEWLMVFDYSITLLINYYNYTNIHLFM